MKFDYLLALGLVQATSNSVPIMSTVPGYQLGTKGSEVEVRVFYDLLCPDSRDAHVVWHDLLPQASPVDGKTYEEFISLEITPFVLPYHLNSFQMTQVVPYLMDQCQKDHKTCSNIDKYFTYCFDHLDDIVTASDKSEVQFEAEWAKTVNGLFGVPEDDILGLFKSGDSHNSNYRVREMWKYAASNGLSGTPMALVNGVRLDVYPTSTDEWKALFTSLYPAKETQFLQ